MYYNYYHLENEGTMQSVLYDAVKESIDAELKEDTPAEDQSDTFEVIKKNMCSLYKYIIKYFFLGAVQRIYSLNNKMV
jgi:hypothetical protein